MVRIFGKIWFLSTALLGLAILAFLLASKTPSQRSLQGLILSGPAAWAHPNRGDCLRTGQSEEDCDIELKMVCQGPVPALCPGPGEGETLSPLTPSPYRI